MPTQSLVPQQDGYWQGWSSIVGGTFAYQVCSDGDDTTYFLLPRLNLPAGRASFPVTLMSDGLVPSSLQVVIRARADSGAGQTMQVGFSRGGVFGSDGVNDSLTTSVANFTHTYATDPVSGGAWTESDLDGLEICISRGANVGNTRILQVSGTLTYSQSRAWRSTASKNAQAA